MNSIHRLLLVGLILCLCSCQQKEPSPPFYLGGIAIKEKHLDDWVNTFKWVGMNTVEVTVYAKQWLWYSEDLEFDPPDQGVINEIRAAKANGLNVVMVLRVQLQHWFEANAFKWHGMILPIGETTLDNWFCIYSDYVAQWAEICEKEQVDVLAIGSEMNALSATIPIEGMPHLYAYYNDLQAQEAFEKRALKYETILRENCSFSGKNDEDLESYLDRKIQHQYHWGQLISYGECDKRIERMNSRRAQLQAHWQQVIQVARKDYSGQLTYAANFDNYHEVGFWEELDFIGINAYFPLRRINRDLPQRTVYRKLFRDSWKAVFEEISAFQEKENLVNKPLMFTELGYTRYHNSTIECWTGDGFSVAGQGEDEQLIIWDKQEAFPQERIWAVESLHEVVEQEKIDLQGILYWKLTTHDYLLDEEPFALHFHQTSADSLQDALLKFLPQSASEN